MPAFVRNHAPRRLALIALLLTAVVAPACDSSTILTNPGDILRSTIVVAVDPNPVPAVVNPISLVVSGTYKVTVSETAGLGGEVVFVHSTVFDPVTGAQVAVNYYDGTDLVVFVGSKRIEAKQSLAIPQTVSYVLPDLRKAATLTVAVQFKDDRGNLINQSLQVKVE
jgi:hypothetical protein